MAIEYKLGFKATDIDTKLKKIDELPITVTPQMYGAKGDGTTDDTAAFQTALAENRIVYVSGGTYKLSGELIIRDNCQLELTQDAVLNFTQTSGNCITLNRVSWLKGNHATIKVPYGFTGHGINVDTSGYTSSRDVPPWTHWDPQWKNGRYIDNINICMATEKTQYAGDLHESKNGDTYGTAVYISANGSYYIWGLNFSGLRISGAFEYGIRAANFNSGWNHEMRLEAFIEACKIGVSFEDCNKAYFAGSIQPRVANDGSVYAKHGIQIIRSRDMELSGARVWDWDAEHSLWTYDKTNINQHIAMYGDCCGAILNDYVYYHVPSGFSDLRELIYTDTPSNFDSLIILQEPITKWFKPENGEPYFNNGSTAERLLLKKEQDALFQTDYVPSFTDRLSTASNGAGAIYNEIGYKKNWYLNTDGVTENSNNLMTTTGFMPASKGNTINVEGMSYETGDGECRFYMYDSNYNLVIGITRDNIIANAASYYLKNYVPNDNGFSISIASTAGTANVAFFRMVVYTSTVGTNPKVAVNEEISYTQVGALTENVKVNSNNLFGMEGYETKGRMVTQISESSTDSQYPSAKAVYNLLEDALGEYVNDIAALIGGNA